MSHLSAKQMTSALLGQKYKEVVYWTVNGVALGINDTHINTPMRQPVFQTTPPSTPVKLYVRKYFPFPEIDGVLEETTSTNTSTSGVMVNSDDIEEDMDTEYEKIHIGTNELKQAFRSFHKYMNMAGSASDDSGFDDIESFTATVDYSSDADGYMDKWNGLSAATKVAKAMRKREMPDEEYSMSDMMPLKRPRHGVLEWIYVNNDDEVSEMD